jgi:hypothetical protein
MIRAALMPGKRGCGLISKYNLPGRFGSLFSEAASKGDRDRA